MKRTFIIAEAGVNHNGNMDIAKKLIDVAKDAGADAVKFQTFKAEKIVTKKMDMAEYQKANKPNEKSQYTLLKQLELSTENHLELIEYCNQVGVEFMSTPFDIESAHFLNELNLSTFKIPSGEITNLPYLREIAKLNKKIIISTGMATLGEIEAVLNIFRKSGQEDITVLHCNTEYPTPMEDVNLNAMDTIKKAFKVKVGYSDHTLGIEIPVAAVAMGATVIEKHFTLDRNLEGPDHKASLEPMELKQMIESIRNIEKALGDGIKYPSKSERKNIDIARKIIVADTDIKYGEVFSECNLTTKRAGGGISPMQWDEIIGRKAKRDFLKDESIEI